MMGIDSISRLNLIRGMPETYNHLESSGWFEMRGFNKIGDNTFPNLMAILTGQDNNVTEETCNWKEVGELDKCPFVWSDFDAAGYVTAYIEDEAYLQTFNYYETGFIKQPTDYYFRPFTLAAEDNLKIKLDHGLKFCVGPQHYADLIYQYGLDFAVTYKDHPSFGFFWTNSFSHEDLGTISSMDTRILHYLKQLEKLRILDDSIVFFFSDHGMRFGPIRDLFTGWLEERLPFLYVWLPKSFQLKHPEIVKNLKINRDRLVSPYDVHMTLKDILQMSGGYEADYVPSATSCPDCQSLFKEMPSDRSCPDAGISKHWCTCTEFEKANIASKEVQLATRHLTNKINEDLKPHPKCAKLTLKSVLTARKSKHGSSIDYLVSFDVKPSMAKLEGTVRCDKECKEMKMIGSISRLNKYGNQSACISDSNLRKTCYCI